jgi:predicted dehydrogenase
VYGSYEDMLADPQIDVVYIPLPNHLHAPWTVKAAQAGKHVLCEKPLALSVAEVDQITAATRENQVVVSEAFMYQHHPSTLKVKELVKAGEIGKLAFLRGEFSFMLTREDDIRWKPEMGGGSIWDVGCYPVSYSILLAGCAPVEVMGWQELSPSGVDRLFAGQLRFENGLLAQFSSSFALPYATFMEIRGTDGHIDVPSPFRVVEEARVTVTRGDQTRTIEFPRFMLYSGEVEQMYDAIVHGQPQRVTLEHSRIHIATLSALLESAQNGGKVVRL